MTDPKNASKPPDSITELFKLFGESLISHISLKMVCSGNLKLFFMNEGLKKSIPNLNALEINDIKEMKELTIDGSELESLTIDSPGIKRVIVRDLKSVKSLKINHECTLVIR